VNHRHRVLVHTARVPIRWGDMDGYGHVNNTVYFRYMEQARIEWAQSKLPEYRGMAMLPLVVVNASCTFLIPLVHPGEVEVRMLLGDLGRTSVGSYYELMMNGATHAEGAAKIVWIDPASGRPVPLPEAVAATLRAPSQSTTSTGPGR